MKRNLLSLDDMMGKTFKYHGKTYHLISYQKTDEKVIIATDRDWLNFESRENLNNFLAQCFEVENTAVIIQKKDTLGMTMPDIQSNDVMAQLKGMLIENIQKVREDPKYVPQAQMVSKTVQTIINLTKMEHEILKLRNQ